MIDLTKRSLEKELLDKDDIPFADIRQNLKELNFINQYLGGHKITTTGIQSFVRVLSPESQLSICEIGCGGGDNLKAISNYCLSKNIQADFTGIDIKPECLAFAKQQYPELDANWICTDYKKADFAGQKPDVIFSSLFCHHFNEEELIAMLQWMRQNSAKGFFINDLQRHPLAYYSIKWLTHLFSRSYLVKNDAALSVARGFQRQEWVSILKAAGIKNFSIHWKWAFRHLIVCHAN